MTALGDALVILVLAGIAFAAAPPDSAATALPAALWLAACSPFLVRSDVVARRLPDVATLPALALLVASVGAEALTSVARGRGPQDALLALLPPTIVALAGVTAARRGAFGMGDVKLAAAIAGSIAQIAPSLLVVVAAVASFGALAAAVPQAFGSRRRRALDGLPAGGPERAKAPDGAEAPKGARVTAPEGRPPPRPRRTIAFGPPLLVGYWCAVGVAAFSPGGSC
jgi:prepilin signal peptidase PulO-like enzyme (type II secretory pathway)